MDTGYLQDLLGKLVPRNVIQSLTCTWGQQVVFRVEPSSGISANPLFEFFVRAEQTAEMHVEWTDDRGVKGSLRQILPTPEPPARSLPLSQIKSGLHYSGKDVQALQADEFANPAQLWLSQGAQAWAQPSAANGKSCVSCHGAVATSMKGVATRYPAIDAASGRLFNLEDRINQCTTRHQQAAAMPPESDALLGLSLLVTQASKGMPLSVDIGGAARGHWQAGATLFSQRQPNGYPVYRLEWQKPGSLERRLRSCYAGIRAEVPPWGALEMRQLALYLMWRGEGLPIEVPAVRK
eukprot:gene1142-1117_t